MTLPCPRRAEMGLRIGEPSDDSFEQRDACSYCGSLNPDTFMARLEAGDIQIGSTDKSYKVYVTNWGGAELHTVKFYFQHLDEKQKQRFVELFNEKKLHFSGGFGFYVWPFFMKPVGAR